MTVRLPDAGTVRGEITREILMHREFLKPPVLEVGAWRPDNAWWRDLRQQLGYEQEEWVGTDMVDGHGVDIVADLTSLDCPLPQLTFNSVLCTETLEHVRHPLMALRNLVMTMRSDAWIIITMPFAFAIHDFPNDYWRFTPSGLQMMLEDAGLVDVETHGFNWFVMRLQDHALDEVVAKRETPMHVFGRGRCP